MYRLLTIGVLLLSSSLAFGQTSFQDHQWQGWTARVGPYVQSYMPSGSFTQYDTRTGHWVNVRDDALRTQLQSKAFNEMLRQEIKAGIAANAPAAAPAPAPAAQARKAARGFGSVYVAPREEKRRDDRHWILSASDLTKKYYYDNRISFPASYEPARRGLNGEYIPPKYTPSVHWMQLRPGR